MKNVVWGYFSAWKLWRWRTKNCCVWCLCI